MRQLKQNEVNLYGCASFFKRARNLHRSLIVISLYRLAERLYRNLECGVRLKGEKRRPKMAEKIDEEKFYATDVRA